METDDPRCAGYRVVTIAELEAEPPRPDPDPARGRRAVATCGPRRRGVLGDTLAGAGDAGRISGGGASPCASRRYHRAGRQSPLHQM